ncbi:MAG: cysteine peptidase family C39 domain-containing protein [Patescibacteria group bacterium]
MGRKNIKPIQQPDDITCGPVSLKHVAEYLGLRASMKRLIELCKTGRNGTSTKHMIEAANKLGLSVMVMEYATLHHLQSALKYRPKEQRAVIVSYLYDLDDKYKPQEESGHWAMVASYLSSKSRIVLLDSATGKRKSYDWSDFRSRWWDFDYKRRRLTKHSKKFRLIRKWQPQLMMVVARDPESLPYFRTETARVFIP